MKFYLSYISAFRILKFIKMLFSMGGGMWVVGENLMFGFLSK